MKWDDDKFVAFDFETSGELPEYALQPWRRAQGKFWATSLAVVRKAPTELIITGGLNPTREDMEAFLLDAVNNDRTIVGWHTIFDISCLLAYDLHELVFKAKWLDGMLLWRHFSIEPEYEAKGPNKKSYGLKACVEKYLPQFAGYQEDVDFHDPSPEARAKLHQYNIRDTTFTLKLAKKWWNRISPRQQRAALVESACLPLVADANLRGMPVDPLVTGQLTQHLADTAAKQLAILAPHGVTEKIVRSPKQLGKLVFEDWKLPVIKTTDTGNPSTDKESLHELSFIDQRARELHLYKEALFNRKKFAENPMEAALYNQDGCAHPLAIVFGTYSGRLTYASKQGKNKDERQIGFALHQEKRDELYRAILVAPPGHTIVEFDAAGQEFRWMAIASEDPTMLSLCLPGQDAHAYMGARIGGLDYEGMLVKLKAGDKEAKDLRQLGKVANLSLQYRTSALKLRTVARVQYGLDMDESTARRIHEAYRAAYRGVPTYWSRQINSTRRSGYVETFAGRRVYVPGNWDGPLGWSMGSTAINYRIQGTGADQKYLALAVLRSYLVRMKIKFAWDLHDGLYFFVPDEVVEQAIPEMMGRLTNLPYEQAWKFTPPIPLPWDCKVGKSWGTLKEWGKK